MKNSCFRLHWLCIGLLFSCGDPLATGDYRGEVMIHLEGHVQLVASDEDRNRPDSVINQSGILKMALFWSTEGVDVEIADPVMSIEHQAVMTGVFPAKYSLDIHTPPPSSVLKSLPDTEGKFAMGMLLVYVDYNENGKWDEESEWVIGGVPGKALVYTPDGIQSQFTGDLGPGYHRMKVVSQADGVCTRGKVYMESEDEGPMHVEINAMSPVAVLLDFDCDGQNDEWNDMCPSIFNLDPELEADCPINVC